MTNRELAYNKLNLFDNALERYRTDPAVMDGLLSDEEFDILKDTNEFAEICQTLAIFHSERANGCEDTVFSSCNSKEELHALMTEMKYLLFRIEFDEETDYSNSILNMIQEYRVSPPMLIMMVKWCNFDRFKVLSWLSKVLVSGLKLNHARYVLLQCLEIRPDCAEAANSLSMIENLLKVSDLAR